MCGVYFRGVVGCPGNDEPVQFEVGPVLDWEPWRGEFLPGIHRWEGFETKAARPWFTVREEQHIDAGSKGEVDSFQCSFVA